MAYDNELDQPFRILDDNTERFGDDDDIVFEHDSTAADENVKIKNRAGGILGIIAQTMWGAIEDIKFFFGDRAANHCTIAYNSSTDRLEFKNDAGTLLFSLGNTDLTAIINQATISQTVESDAASVIKLTSHLNSGLAHARIVGNAARGGGTAAIVQDADIALELEVGGYDGVAFQKLARLTVEVDGTPGVNDMPGRIKLWTTPDGGVTPILAITVAQDGTVTFVGGIAAASATFVGSMQSATLSVTSTAVITGLLTLTAGITGMFITAGGRRRKQTSVDFAASPYTVLDADHILRVDPTSGAVTLALQASPGTGRELIIKDIAGQAATNNITIDPDGAGTIDGAATYVINENYGQVTLHFNGTNWENISKPQGISAPFGDGDKGDITVSASGATWTIDASAVTTTKIADSNVTTAKIADDNVTYSKIQDVSATDKLLGRSTAGAGVVEEITCTAAGRALLDDADAAAQRTTLVMPSGAWTIGSVSGTNLASSTVRAATYSRAGDIVTCAGAISITPTSSAALTIARFDPPIASNFTTEYEANGAACAYDDSIPGIAPGRIASVAVSDKIEIVFISISTDVHEMAFECQYQIV